MRVLTYLNQIVSVYLSLTIQVEVFVGTGESRLWSSTVLRILKYEILPESLLYKNKPTFRPRVVPI